MNILVSFVINVQSIKWIVRQTLYSLYKQSLWKANRKVLSQSTQATTKENAGFTHWSYTFTATFSNLYNSSRVIAILFFSLLLVVTHMTKRWKSLLILSQLCFLEANILKTSAAYLHRIICITGLLIFSKKRKPDINKFPCWKPIFLYEVYSGIYFPFQWYLWGRPRANIPHKLLEKMLKTGDGQDGLPVWGLVTALSYRGMPSPTLLKAFRVIT